MTKSCTMQMEELGQRSRYNLIVMRPLPNDNSDLDPLIEAYKKDVDLTLILENLRRTVDQRFQRHAQLQEFAEELRRAGRELRRPR